MYAKAYSRTLSLTIFGKKFKLLILLAVRQFRNDEFIMNDLKSFLKNELLNALIIYHSGAGVSKSHTKIIE